jgi:hypothetical protein
MRILLFSSLTFQTPTKNKFKKFFCILLFEGTFTSFFEDKKSKRSHKIVEIKVFLTIFGIFCLMIEGSGSGSIPLTNGSGYRRPKNMWIRILIRNIAYKSHFLNFPSFTGTIPSRPTTPVLCIRICSNAEPDPAFYSMRIPIPEAKPMRIHAEPDPGQALPPQKIANILVEKKMPF